MRFSVKFMKKQAAVAFLLLILLTALPLLSVQASVGLLYFRAVAGPDFIMLEWETAQELDNLGFNLYRGLTGDFDQAVKLNSSLIPGQTGDATGAFYQWPDNNVEIGVQYTYWLEDVDINSNSTVHDPVTATAGGGSTIPTVPPPGGGGNNTATPTPSRTPTWTPSPTTQSGATAAPTRTPTRTPIPQPTSSNSNPTPTTAPQIQVTAVTNTNTAATAAPQNTFAAPETENEEANLPAATNSAPAPDSEINTGGEAAEATPLTLAQTSTEQQSGSNPQLGNAIGQDSQGSEGDSALNPASPDESSRSTLITMALIASVILLIAGGGGIIALLLNRNKQPRI
jgi:hypothetical protein